MPENLILGCTDGTWVRKMRKTGYSIIQIVLLWIRKGMQKKGRKIYLPVVLTKCQAFFMVSMMFLIRFDWYVGLVTGVMVLCDIRDYCN